MPPPIFTVFSSCLNNISALQSLCSIPYNVHNVSRGVQDIGSSYEDDNCITMRCDKKAKRSSCSTFESCGQAVIEALASRAEMLRTLGHYQVQTPLCFGLCQFYPIFVSGLNLLIFCMRISLPLSICPWEDIVDDTMHYAVKLEDFIG